MKSFDSSSYPNIKMLGTTVILLAIAATGFAQAPEGYRTVYITSNVNPKFVIVPKARTSGTTTIVYVSLLRFEGVTP